MDNRTRILSEVVSLDAWHSPFERTKKSAAVNIELSFREGRLGGDDTDFPYTFKIALKRARLEVRLEDPLSIDRNSVARNVPEAQIEQTKIRTIRDTLNAKVGAGGNINLSDFHAALSGSANASRENRREEELRVVQALPPILVSSEPKNSREYAWTLEPSYLPTLLGQPWDPVSAPRLLAKYKYSDIQKLPPAISVDITCAMEDILVDDIQPKDKSLAEKLIGRLNTDVRTIAAKQHLASILRASNLEPGKMDNRFAALMIASVLATVED